MRVTPGCPTWTGLMEGPLLKHNTNSSSSEYARRVHCVLMGYTLFEYDSEAEAKAGLWPRTEADVIGVSPAPSNSAAMRAAMSLSSSTKDAHLTFVYTTTAGERVCAVAPSARECERWIVALTLGVELLLLSGLPEGAGGAATCEPHAPPPADATATHCAASGAQFGYTVTRHICAASGRAFAGAHMSPNPLPLPGVGLSQAARLSDACAQAQQLLNIARCRARLLAAAAHAQELEATLERKYKSDKREMWLLLARHRGGDDANDDEKPDALEVHLQQREAAIDLAEAAFAAYTSGVLDAIRGDTAELVAELHWLCTAPPDDDDDGAAMRQAAAAAQFSPTAPPATIREDDDAPQTSGDASRASDHAAQVRRTDLRLALPPPAHAAAVRDVLSALLQFVAADDDVAAHMDERPTLFDGDEALLRAARGRRSHAGSKDKAGSKGNGHAHGQGRSKRPDGKRDLLFYLPQLAHIYYRQLPPRAADAALRVTLIEETLLRLARRSFQFALRLAWTLVAYLEDRGAAPRRRPHALRLLIELEAAAATKSSASGDGDPWALCKDSAAAAAMARRGPLPGELSPFAGAVALELLPRAPPWMALELRRAASSLRRAAVLALATLGVQAVATGTRFGDSTSVAAPDDVLAREMRFVRAMCDVAESMRSVELSQRPTRLRRELEALPRLTPLGHSPIGPTVASPAVAGYRRGHALGRVARIPAAEGHVFKTKARAPTLMLLETVDDAADWSDDSSDDGAETMASRDGSPQCSDDDAADAAIGLSMRLAAMQTLVAPMLSETPSSPAPGVDVSEKAMRERAVEDLLSVRAARRVSSVPSIVEAAYAAEADVVSVDDFDLTPRKGKRTKAPPPGALRRASSQGALAVLPETPPPKSRPAFDGADSRESRTPPRDAAKSDAAPSTAPSSTAASSTAPASEDAPSLQAARLAAEPVASGSSARNEVVRALRKKSTLGLKLDRLVSHEDVEEPAPRVVGLLREFAAVDEAAADAKVDDEESPPPPDAAAGSDDADAAARRPGFGESWAAQRARIRRSTPIGHEKSWNLVSCIVKSNDDLRQEVCALQIVAACLDAFEASGLAGDASGLWLRHYSIVPTGASTGVIETMADAISLDALKKSSGYTTLASHLKTAHAGALGLAKARKAFISSMAAYSLVCHLLGLKDRHNGNILMDSHGHVVHIDFGFMLGQAPGGSFSLERVPFKLTAEMVDAMGGWASDGFSDFVILLVCGFMALQQHQAKILALVEVMARDSPFPCFRNAPGQVIEKMRARLKLGLTTKEQVAHHVTDLVRQSYNAYGTRQYDSFQYLTNGIYI